MDSLFSFPLRWGFLYGTNRPVVFGDFNGMYPQVIPVALWWWRKPATNPGERGTLDPAGPNVGKTCAMVMLDHGGEPNRRWPPEATEAGDVTFIGGVSSPQQVIDFVRKNKCCSLYLIGHRGGPVNEGGIVTYPDPSNRDASVTILPNSDLQQQLAAAFRENCKQCAINIVSCGDANDPAGRKFRKGLAEQTGCIVCGSTRTIAIGYDCTLRDVPCPSRWGNVFGEPVVITERWPHSCEVPSRGGWGLKCVKWGRIFVQISQSYPAGYWKDYCLEHEYVPQSD